MADNESGLSTGLFRSTIKVLPVERVIPKATRDDFLDILSERGISFDEEDEPFFFSCRASNAEVDSYYTHMLPTSLKNYAEDADRGVQFQNSHNGSGTGGLFGGGSPGEVGFGRSLRGKYVRAKNETVIDFYTIAGLTCGNMTSDQFIKGARTGIYSDVSIGFMPGEFICDICGGDMLKRWSLDWDDPSRCTHWLGDWYEVEERGKKRQVQCTAGVNNARLNEVSVVYDGATPGAAILAVDMARMAAARGEIDDPMREHLSQLYRVNIPEIPRIFTSSSTEATMSGQRKLDPKKDEQAEADMDSVATTQENQENPPAPPDMNETVVQMDEPTSEEDESRSAEPMERLRTKYQGTGIQLGSDPYVAIERLADAFISARGKIKTLEREAKDGRDFRESILTELDASVVRAFGADGADEAQARYRRMAANEDIAGVKLLIADLEGIAKKRLPAGQTTTVIATDGEREGEETPADRRPLRRGPTRADLVA